VQPRTDRAGHEHAALGQALGQDSARNFLGDAERAGDPILLDDVILDFAPCLVTRVVIRDVQGRLTVGRAIDARELDALELWLRVALRELLERERAVAQNLTAHGAVALDVEAGARHFKRRPVLVLDQVVEQARVVLVAVH